MRKTLYILLLLAATFTVAAQTQDPPARPSRMPATPHPIQWVQPSGDTIMFRLIGDERWSCRYTLDGYALVENKKGALCYAKVDCKGNLKPTYITASIPERRTKRELCYIEKMKKNEKLFRHFPEPEP